MRSALERTLQADQSEVEVERQRKEVEPETDPEIVVYSVISPESVRAHRVYDEENIQAAGGIHAIERTLERDCYWYARLGEIKGEVCPHGVTYRDAEYFKLIAPPAVAWRIGMRNPAYSGTELERLVFQATFEAIEILLKSWNCEEDGVVDAYALKELRITRECLASIINGLRNLRQVYELARITAIKYWYDVTWPGPHEPDLILAEYSLNVPFRVGWPDGNKILDVQVLPLCPC
jgi:hypothetical protein